MFYKYIFYNRIVPCHVIPMSLKNYWIFVSHWLLWFGNKKNTFLSIFESLSWFTLKCCLIENYSLDQGWANILIWGPFYKLFGPFGPHFGKPMYKITFYMKYQLIKLKKISPRARLKTSAGRIWPVGRTLPTPDPNFSFQSNNILR